jgi:hypothetical protein
MPPAQSLLEQQAEFAMHVPPQSFGVLAGHTHWLFTQAFPPVQSLDAEQVDRNLKLST